MGQRLTKTNTMALDLTAANEDLKSVDLKNTPAFNTWVFGLMKQAGKSFAAGGFFEPRVVYSRSAHFGGEEPRSTHLGVDVWVEAGRPVYAPFDGLIHSFADNEGFGNYGPTLILEHSFLGQTFFSLYGHVTRADMPSWQVGQSVAKGQVIAHVGPYPENGDWPPHLHFQLMHDMQGNWGDFPGVCRPSEEPLYRSLMMDPAVMLGEW